MTEINAHQPGSLSLPPNFEVSRNTVGEGGLGILAPVVDSRRIENNLNFNGPCSVDMGKSTEKSALEALLSNHMSPLKSKASEPMSTLPHPSRPTVANLFVPNFKSLDLDPQPSKLLVAVSHEQHRCVDQVGRQICQFYKLACQRLKPIQWVREEAGRQHAIFEVELVSLLSAISLVESECVNEEQNEDGGCLGASLEALPDPDSPVEHVLAELQSIHSIVERSLEMLKSSNCRPPSLGLRGHQHLKGARAAAKGRRAGGFSKPPILRELQNAVRALKDGNKIDNFRELCLVVNPLEGPHSEIEMKLRKYKILSKASSGLLQSISMACSAHDEHTVWLNLDAAVCEEQVVTSAVFHIAFDCPDERDKTTSFRVQSLLDDEPSKAAETATTAVATHQSPPDSSPDGTPAVSTVGRRRSSRLCDKNSKAPKTAKDAVRGSRVVKRRSPPRRLAPIVQPKAVTQERRDSVIRQLEHEFCLSLYKQQFGVDWNYKIAARFLTPTGKHDIFFPNSDRVMRKPESLRDLFNKISTIQDPLMASAFDATQKRRIAKLIIKAFLSFNSSRWLRDSWDMKNMFVYNMSADDSRFLYEPIVKASIPGKASVGTDNDDELSVALTPAEHENMRIMLGTILIEVALADRRFETVIEALRKPSQRDNLPQHCGKTGLIGELVARRVGTTYREVVEDCMKRDYGEDALRGFYKTISDKLSKLGQGGGGDNDTLMEMSPC